MNKNLEKIHEYLINKGISENVIKGYDSSSVYLAMEIMEYAHRGQTRENGEDHANHPSRVLFNYQNLVGIDPTHKYPDYDEDLMIKCGVPYKGVQEVCLLHDVIEDTEFTIEDVKDIYYECGFDKYFDMHIKDALKRITHDKDVDYKEYISICLRNPISALVKMMDLQDNLRVIDLVELNQDNLDRAHRYPNWLFLINDVYHFVEKVKKYKEELNND